jgi:hypothetical protein
VQQGHVEGQTPAAEEGGHVREESRNVGGGSRGHRDTSAGVDKEGAVAQVRSMHGGRRTVAVEMEMDKLDLREVRRPVHERLEQDRRHRAAAVHEDAVTAPDHTNGELGRGGWPPRDPTRAAVAADAG